MKKYLILLCLIFSFLFGYTQIISYDWLRTMGGENDDKPIHLSSQDNNSCNLAIYSPGSSDSLFLTDTSFAGNYNHLFRLETNGEIIPGINLPNISNALFINFIFNSYSRYTLCSKISFSSITYGSSISNLVTNSQDIYVVKDDLSGNPISILGFGGSGIDEPTHFVLDSDGNIIITGYYNSPNLSFAGTTIGNSGTEDAFIAKYDSLGNELWIRRIASLDDDEPEALAVDDYGNIYYAQITYEDFLWADGNFLYANNSNGVSFLLKFDPNGNLIWNKLLHSNASSIYDQNFICDVEIDNSNNVLISGYSSGLTFLFDSDTIWSSNVYPVQPYCHNPFIVKLDTSGSVLWSKYAITEFSLNESVQPVITYDKDNCVYFSFCYEGDTIIFDNDTIIPVSQITDKMPILSKFDSSGVRQWYNNLEAQPFAYLRELDVADNYDIYMSGVFNSVYSIQFDSLVSPSFYTNSNDIFLLKATQYVPDHTKHFVNLNLGWSIISSYVDPYVPDCDSVFADVATYMVLMKNEIGETFWPMYNVNTIGDLQIGEGYIIKMYNFNILEVSGIAIVPEWSPLALLQDWNIIGYLRQNSGVISTMLNDISQNIVMVKNGNGLIYWPMYGIDNIGNMNPGEGYQIKMLAADTLLYPAN
ncbi:MAG: hypothetical protein HN347_07145 [Bacteroidetes bacterium]|jgi:hypothetical protein|nr:hypothetical protein [Bacteroidota bacterium]